MKEHLKEKKKGKKKHDKRSKCTFTHLILVPTNFE
jgi:hypothetical protein